MFIAKANKRRLEIAISLPSMHQIIPSGIVRHEHDDVSNPNFWLKTRVSGPRCVVSKNEVVSFSGLVTTEAGFVQCLVARLAILKVTEPPATRCGVLF